MNPAKAVQIEMRAAMVVAVIVAVTLCFAMAWKLRAESIRVNSPPVAAQNKPAPAH